MMLANTYILVRARGTRLQAAVCSCPMASCRSMNAIQKLRFLLLAHVTDDLSVCHVYRYITAGSLLSITFITSNRTLFTFSQCPYPKSVGVHSLTAFIAPLITQVGRINPVIAGYRVQASMKPIAWTGYDVSDAHLPTMQVRPLHFTRVRGLTRFIRSSWNF